MSAAALVVIALSVLAVIAANVRYWERGGGAAAARRADDAEMWVW